MDDQLDSSHHHDQCPICQQQFLGFTDADMIEHVVVQHEDEISDHIDLTGKESVECDNCGREYVTYMGECPFCQHDGEPYK